ncbi:MAG: ExbD/TolR family protein [Phycisphaerales bacterium]
MKTLRMRNAASVASKDFGPNMTPMVDVVMVILIFFMAGSAILGPEWFVGARVDDAAAAAEGNTEPEERPADDPFALDLEPTRVKIELRGDGQGGTLVRGLNLEGASLDDLAARLDELRDAGVAPTLEIVVQPSSSTAYQDVIRAYELCLAIDPKSASLARSNPE